jgi:hypothetical protein
MLYTCKLSWLLGTRHTDESGALIYHHAVNRHCSLVLLAVRSTIYLHMKLVYHFNHCTQQVRVLYICIMYLPICNNICILITLSYSHNIVTVLRCVRQLGYFILFLGFVFFLVNQNLVCKCAVRKCVNSA